MRGRARRGRALATALAVLLVCAGVVAPARAHAPESDADLRVLVVLDVSGSMERDGGHGQSLLDGARRALSELAFSLPRDASMGLRAYGSEYAGTDRARSCRDSRLLAPLERIRPARLVSEAARLEPTGDTPIGYALTRAAEDFADPGGARDVIVLISDGEDNCSTRPPCEIVKSLKRNGLEVRVETVGVALGQTGEARNQLRCIADATGGDYYDADNSDALSAALRRISQQATGRLGTGRSIEAASRPETARSIRPGAYRLRMSPGDSAWFRFDAPVGAHPRVLATIEGGDRSVMPRELRKCPSWRAELRNRGGEGFVYPPYGNSGVFDGVDFGSTGASTSHPLEESSTGIDYAGPWTIRLALGLDGEGELLECAKYLSAGRYDVRFSLDYDGLDAEAEGPEETEEPQPDPSIEPLVPSPTPPTTSSEPSAADKYRRPVSEPEAPTWQAPLLAGLLALGAIGLGLWVYRLRRRRARGW